MRFIWNIARSAWWGYFLTQLLSKRIRLQSYPHKIGKADGVRQQLYIDKRVFSPENTVRDILKYPDKCNHEWNKAIFTCRRLNLVDGGIEWQGILWAKNLLSSSPLPSIKGIVWLEGFLRQGGRARGLARSNIAKDSRLGLWWWGGD